MAVEALIVDVVASIPVVVHVSVVVSFGDRFVSVLFVVMVADSRVV